MPMIGNPEDVSLYFHVPFCSKKCPYCHFFVLPNEDKFKQPFVQALLQEWTLRLPQLFGKKIVSIYFGGGTPTKLSPQEYQRILDTIYRSGIQIAPDCEITLEANPEDVTAPQMRAFHLSGINRVSLGVQSLNDLELITLGRTHNAANAKEAIYTVHRAGITNLSIDLMFELPHQTLKSWEENLNHLSTLPITHLSLYNLTFEPHTPFFKRAKQLISKLPPDEDRLQMLEIATQALESIGLIRYEISAFAKGGQYSRHNTGYWLGRPFLGFGPSAFSYWEGSRFSNIAHFNQYLSSLAKGDFPVDFTETLPFPRNLQELIAVNLRLVDGVDLQHFTKRYGKLPEQIENALQTLIEKKWVAKNGNHIKLTSSGHLFYDSVAIELI